METKKKTLKISFSTPKVEKTVKLTTQIRSKLTTRFGVN